MGTDPDTATDEAGVTYDVSQGTFEDCLLVEIDCENVKQMIPRLNEAIGRLLTLATGMTGGALGLLKDEVCVGWGRAFAVGFFAAAVCLAAFAAVPYQTTVIPQPTGIREAMDAARRWKRRFLWAVTGCIAAGLLATLAGTAVRAAVGPPEPPAAKGQP